MIRNKITILLSLLLTMASCAEKKSKKQTHSDNKASIPPHIVFVSGDEEYRSEESLPMLAKLAKRELNAKVTVCYALDSTGIINPNNTNHISNLEALETADLMVIFTRYRTLPKKERDYIVNYAESGKPIVGFRTATHAFKYKDPSLEYWNDEWPTKVFGQQWITHHGHFDDGKFPVTQISAIAKEHPILRGFDSFKAYSWLYHVDGGAWKLFGDSKPILRGHSLKSKHEMDGKLDEFPLTNPVAWTKSYTGSSGKKAKVFFTTLGHPYDFKLPVVRKIALNGIFWALDKAHEIPSDGSNVHLDEPFEPNNSGFGTVYKPNLRPRTIH